MTQISLLKKRIPLSVWLRLLMLIGLILTGVLVARYTTLGELLDQDRLAATINELRGLWWAPFLLVGLYILLSSLGLPPSPLLVAGALFGPFLGSIYNISGLCIGAASSYLIANLLGREFVVRIAGERLRRAETLFDRHGFWPLVQTRFLPIPFAVVNFGAALAGVRPVQFLSAAVVGLIPSTLIHTYFIAILLESSGRERVLNLALYAGTFIVFNLLISALWIRGKAGPKYSSSRPLSGLVRKLILKLDDHLRRKLKIFEYSDDPKCMFRVHVTRANRDLKVPQGEIPQGTKVLELHFWNDHIPRAAAQGESAGRSIKGFRMFKNSMAELARVIEHDDRMTGVEAVGGLMPLFLEGDSYPAEKMLSHLGFAVNPYHGYKRFLGLIGKQMHGWMMMWAFNPVTLKNRDLFGLRWADCWMTRRDLIRRHAGKQKNGV